MSAPPHPEWLMLAPAWPRALQRADQAFVSQCGFTFWSQAFWSRFRPNMIGFADMTLCTTLRSIRVVAGLTTHRLFPRRVRLEGGEPSH
jgi:hypothetical protein